MGRGVDGLVVLEILLGSVAVLLVLGGLAGAIHPLLPGPPLVFLGLWMGAWLGDYERVGGRAVLALAALAALAQLLDFLASALGAKRMGASRRAVVGAVLGTVVGLFFGLPGLLLGPFVGAVAGELSASGGIERSTRVGLATWAGQIAGVLMKLALSLFMVGLFILLWLF
jgi:uncharacterized protein